MLENKNQVSFYIREVMKRVILEAEYPKDKAPSQVKLVVPYKTGVIATIKDIEDAIKKIDIDPDIDLTNLVDLKSEQTIQALKIFQEGLQSLKEPKADEDVIRLSEFKKLNEELIAIRDSIGDLNNVNINLGDDIDRNIENILNKMIKIIGDGPQDVDVNYTNPERVPTTLGGVLAGTTFDEMPIQDVITMLLYPYQVPAITQFSSNLKTNFKLGESTGSNLTLTWNTSNQKNIKENSIVFYFNNKELPKENFPKQGSKQFTITPVVLTSQGSINIWMDMFDIKGKKIGKGITLTWLNGIYYGNNTKEDITADNVADLKSMDANSLGRDYKYPGGGYKYIVFPAAWADPKQFIDPATNFDVPMEKRSNINITNENGVSQDYKVYRSTNVLNGEITIRIKV